MRWCAKSMRRWMINQNFIDCKIRFFDAKWFFLVSISFFIKKEHNTHYTFYRQYKIDNKSLWWNRILSDSNKFYDFISYFLTGNIFVQGSRKKLLKYAC